MGLLSSRKKPAASSPFRPQSSLKSVENWKLNAEFFTALSQWTLDHPDSTLVHVFQRVNEAIDNGKEYMDLIPDTPFPARSLVKSVAQLLQLSAKITCSQNEVRDFATEIIQWVGQVKESFVKAGNGWFTSITWNNLADIRSLIDEICGWAAERLKDGRWNLKNVKIEGEIEEFRARLDDARRTFNDRSLIVISGGLDAIFQFLWALFFGQYILIIALENLQRTQDEHFKQILKEHERRSFLEGKLRARTVDDPSYITQNKHPCDPGTRKEVIEEVKAWINDHSETSKNFLWLVGPPGCGKSAITASIVEYCQSHEILGAQFFINRSNHNTTDPRLYFPTVARDLCKWSESVEEHLHDALKGRNFSVDTPEKAADVFLDTIGKAARDSPDDPGPIVVVFDGLDETSRDQLENTATIFARLFPCLRKYPNAKVLISSRPEDEILRTFKHTPGEEYIIKLPLNTNDPNCRRDVKTFLKRRLTEIAERHGLTSIGWPGNDDLEILAERASGLFVWAVTASNYINARLRIQGKEILKTVLEQFDNKAMKEINTLYQTILDSAYTEDIDNAWIFETFRRLIGAIMVLREPLNIRNIDALLDLREIPDSDRVDVRNFVENLRTLLVADLDDVTEDIIPRVHKSFFDFITSSHIPERFRVDIEASNAEMALLCYRHLTIAYSDIHDTQYASKQSNLMALSVSARYSLRFGFSHTPQQEGAIFGVFTDHLGIVKPSQLNDFFNHSSHPTHAGLSLSVPSDHAFVRTSFEKNFLVWNLKDGSATTPILIPTAHPTWIFSDGGRFFTSKQDNFGYNIVQRDLYDPRNCSSVIVVPLDTLIFDISFDGSRMAFGGAKGTVSLHNLGLNPPVFELPTCGQGMVEDISFSRNCSYIASVSQKNHSMHIWDLKNGLYINKLDSMLHENSVECVVFSSDETSLLSCDNQRAYIWEVPGCNKKHSFEFHPGGRQSIAFSPDCQIVLAGSKEGHVFLWNPHTGEQIGEPWNVPTKGDNNGVYRVAFRSCGNIALACCEGSVYVWNVYQGTLLYEATMSRNRPDAFKPNAVFTPDGSQLLYETWGGDLGICNLAPLLLDSKSTFKPKWTAFSPTGNLVVSVAADNILCWKLDALKVVGDPLKGGATSVNAVAFSVDETRIAGATEDGTVYLWDSSNHELLSSSSPGCVYGVSSLSFSPDCNAIVARLKDGQLVVLTVTDGGFSIASEDEGAKALQKVESTPKSTFFDLNKSPITFGTGPAAPNRRLKDVRWYPSRSDSVVWAYVDNHIIRAGKDGSFVVVPVSYESRSNKLE